MTEEVAEKKNNGWGGARPNSGGARPNSGGKRAGAGSGGARPNTGGARPGAGRKPINPDEGKSVVLNLMVPMSMKIYVQENGGAGFVRALIEAHQKGELKV